MGITKAIEEKVAIAKSRICRLPVLISKTYRSLSDRRNAY